MSDNVEISSKYRELIDKLLDDAKFVVPNDINELQKNYLLVYMRKSMSMMASSIYENKELEVLPFEKHCFYIQIFGEWSFHKLIDLFRSGIPAKYWKPIMTNIWFSIWEVMFACVKSEADDTVTLNLIEKYVSITYNEEIYNLKKKKIIDDDTVEKAKEQSNIEVMALEMKTRKDAITSFVGFLKIFFGVVIILSLGACIYFGVNKTYSAIVVCLLCFYLLLRK